MSKAYCQPLLFQILRPINSLQGCVVKQGKDAFYMKFLSLECKENRADCLVKYQVYNYRAKNFKELRDAYKKNIGNYKFKGFSK
jgi:hypothetical protein